MKKIIIFFLGLSLIMFGCFSDDEDKTELAWENLQNSIVVKDISWVSNAVEDQNWEGILEYNAKTDFKEITVLSGGGECIDEGGNPYEIEFLDENNVRQKSTTLAENESHLLQIDSLAKKKKGAREE